MIEVIGLVKRYKDFEAVKGIDLTVKDGEVFGFLGPNGAGKSTTISILCTLLKATAGEVSVAGIDVRRQPDEVRRRIGLVFQDPSLDDQLTARENLEFHGFVYGLPAAVRKERIAEVLAMVNLEERADTQVRTFSGGMKRRLEIARGVMHHPSVLFLDEPTLGLDPQTRNHIWDYLHELRRREGITLFMTTHYMDEAEFCERIAIIDQGTIVAQGTPDELKAMVGGDVISITAAAPQALAEEIDRAFKLATMVERDRVRVEVPEASTFVPILVKELKTPLRSLTLSRPSLDDVFIKLTGHAIRDEAAGGMDQFRAMAQRWGGPRRR
ncbi:MAG TPA: ATP-binding cassette domain-containing protein [Candidatus Dormibacteraeota bacterium]|jgi:ABC-2 type transport system ATP-binding protein|nr:ATP-binding cassette domain-containing protein [Candidatus Dormibacteraeota bacterium]